MARVSPKYSSTEIVEYSTILIIEIGFGENTLSEKRKKSVLLNPISIIRILEYSTISVLEYFGDTLANVGLPKA